MFKNDGNHEQDDVTVGQSSPMDTLRDALELIERQMGVRQPIVEDPLEALKNRLDRFERNYQQQQCDAGPQAQTVEHHALEHLHREIALLAREQTLRELSERWSVLEREVAQLPKDAATHQDITQVKRQLQSLAIAMETMAEAQQHFSSQDVDVLHHRLDEITRAIASIPKTPVQSGFDRDTMERFEARMAGLVSSVETNQQAKLDHIEDHLAALATSLEALKGAPTAEHGVDLPLLKTMADRLEAVAARIETQEHLASDTTAAMTSALDSHMQSLSEQLIQTRDASGHTDAFARLDGRLDTLQELLSGHAVPEGVALDERFKAIEKQIAASQQAIIQNLQNASDKPDTSARALDAIAQRLSALEQLSSDAASQSAHTVDSIHELLHSVSEQLSGLEARLSPEVAPVQPASAEAAVPPIALKVDEQAQGDDAPITLAKGTTPEKVEETPRITAQENADFDFIAAARRAAQAAAADAANQTPQKAKPVGSKKSADTLRAPMLAGTAVVLSSLLAIPLVSQLGDESTAEQASATSVPTGIDTMTTASIGQASDETSEPLTTKLQPVDALTGRTKVDTTSARVVRNVQTLLTVTGHYAGPVDGHVSEAMRKAIAAFQAERNLTVTGEINQALIERLIQTYASSQQP